MGQFEACEKGGKSVVVANGKGNIAEGPGFNICAVKNGILTTPGEGILEGITRKSAVELANEHGYEFIQNELSPVAARSADELFATSAAGDIVAIMKIDCQKVSAGEVCPITRELQDIYWALHNDPRYAHEVRFQHR